MPRYTITEPHPTARNYIHSGRGGAGNHFKAPKTSNPRTATGPASYFQNGLPETASKFSSGRGGAGNIHLTSEKQPFSFDDELNRQRTRESKMKSGAAYHVGRGELATMPPSLLRPRVCARTRPAPLIPRAAIAAPVSWAA